MASLAPSSRAVAGGLRSRQARVARTQPVALPMRSRRQLKAQALLGGSDDKNDKKALTREEEPEEYWSTAFERSGKSPLQDPLAIIGIVSILFPFIFLLAAIAFGWIDTSVYR